MKPQCLSWANDREGCNGRRTESRGRITEIDRQIETLLDRIMEGKSETLVASYERRVEKLEREKLLLNEKLGAHAKLRQSPSQEFEPALRFLKNPMNLWRSDDLARKQAVMKMLFAARPGYKKKIGVRTPIYTCPVNALAAMSGGKSEMAHPRGFEPLTFAFGARKDGFRYSFYSYARPR